MTRVNRHGRTPEARAFRVERVLEAGMALATRGGYEAVQMREVARIAGVALSTLYRYYPSKDALLSAAIQVQLDELRKDILQRPPRQRTPEGRAAEVLHRAFRAMQYNRGFAHAALSAYHIPKPLGEQPDDSSPLISGDDSAALADLMALAAWGPEHRTTPAEYRVLHMLESLWSSSVVAWLNGRMTPEYVEDRLKFAAKRLLPVEAAAGR
ncbi:TetR/AcrR family transcriptional regulator [Nonomuraea terrae]|uniref:TetR/AcrR family transcriptional regulator n=1 Tax=Nonomuraea terrae TaxID=2530383 RepID=A0A4R4YJH7_9ACTN|nr:TetR family transcriptional regulator [Nonomuraea terrae]TDD45098.1 TetR/AcrR family transcriptional regulator [Nonomuraea terrae]